MEFAFIFLYLYVKADCKDPAEIYVIYYFPGRLYIQYRAVVLISNTR